jgi:hypothetical protein
LEARGTEGKVPIEGLGAGVVPASGAALGGTLGVALGVTPGSAAGRPLGATTGAEVRGTSWALAKTIERMARPRTFERAEGDMLSSQVKSVEVSRLKIKTKVEAKDANTNFLKYPAKSGVSITRAISIIDLASVAHGPQHILI